MTRYIRLPLGPSTTATHCGDCILLGTISLVDDGVDEMFCSAFQESVFDDLRLTECVQAEAKDGPQTYTARPRGKR